MFFRREKLQVPAFGERLEQLKGLGFTVTPEGASKARITKGPSGAVIEDRGEEHPHVNKAGMLIGGEIGLLVSGGFQMFWQTPAGKREPARSTQLKVLHAFEEDLKEALGLTSLYNQSLGTTSDLHLYDRIANRDGGVPVRAWEK